MIKLIKQVDDEVLYWEIWKDGKALVIHYGIVGDTGDTEEMKLSLFQKAEKVMDELAEVKVNDGYDYLDEDEMEKALEKRHSVEDLINECLGWTGNGACDGGDIGSGTVNIFNFVVDVEKALKTIIEELTNNNLLEGIKIACLNPDDEEHIALYPKGTEFELI
ncbi:hypothetical protein ABER98_21180 [Domibacillus aminovorans]|uniref:hypothetical protein n=1 Tax=Domibacillus aminovorans TaxID=29332 RepID=UPI003D19708A